jgi:hypothetical protein
MDKYEHGAVDAGGSSDETGTSAQAAETTGQLEKVKAMGDEAEMDRRAAARLMLDRRVSLALGVHDLIPMRLPGGVVIRVSIDYILQENVRKGIVDLTGQTSHILTEEEWRGSVRDGRIL